MKLIQINQQSKLNDRWLGIIGIILFMMILGGCSNSSEETSVPANDEETIEQTDNPYTDITIATVGDIMFHDNQLESAYDQSTNTYDFSPMFSDVQPILKEADLTIANFETTVAGPDQPYVGFPRFNTPDEAIDAIKDAGIDVLITANNHSLDTGEAGLKRTVKTIQEKGLDNVGTYATKPNSRIFIKEIENIKLAILAYTESTNGLGEQFPKEKLDAMLNLMEKDRIIADIEEAKSHDVDLIISYMHWGEEYMDTPNDTQIEFAEMMAAEGVDLILGSHPHVIQKSDIISTNNQDTFVIYSMGNFISNQRLETLGEEREQTEDGIILNYDIRKDHNTGETFIRHVEYIPTWVYRHENNEATYTYRILPVEEFLNDDEIQPEYKERMERALDSTVSKMYPEPFSKQ